MNVRARGPARGDGTARAHAATARRAHGGRHTQAQHCVLRARAPAARPRPVPSRAGVPARVRVCGVGSGARAQVRGQRGRRRPRGASLLVGFPRAGPRPSSWRGRLEAGQDRQLATHRGGGHEGRGTVERGLTAAGRRGPEHGSLPSPRYYERDVPTLLAQNEPLMRDVHAPLAPTTPLTLDGLSAYDGDRLAPLSPDMLLTRDGLSTDGIDRLAPKEQLSGSLGMLPARDCAAAGESLVPRARTSCSTAFCQKGARPDPPPPPLGEHSFDSRTSARLTALTAVRGP